MASLTPVVKFTRNSKPASATCSGSRTLVKGRGKRGGKRGEEKGEEREKKGKDEEGREGEGKGEEGREEGREGGVRRETRIKRRVLMFFTQMCVY